MTEASEMVERVAMAIRASCTGSLMPNQQSAERFARAAIEAFREPTEGMHEAWGAEDYDDHPAECYINPRRWSAMIDAALGSEP